jgi:hypothetical protein
MSLVMMLIPFFLNRWGRTLRKKIPLAREHMDDLEDQEMEASEVFATTAFGRG